MRNIDRLQYKTVTGIVRKIDTEIGHTITVNEISIAFQDILSITAADERIFEFCLDD